jgi:predicted phage terminase large subunit-like protein
MRAWDLAASKESGTMDPSWTVGVKIAIDDKDKFWIEDTVRLRGSPGEVEDAIKNTAKADGKAVEIFLPQDPGQAGKVQVGYLVAKLAGYKVVFETMTGAKETRADPVSSQAKAGNITLVSGNWVASFLDELCTFPRGRHNDQVDALSSGFAKLIDNSKRARILGGRI